MSGNFHPRSIYAQVGTNEEMIETRLGQKRRRLKELQDKIVQAEMKLKDLNKEIKRKKIKTSKAETPLIVLEMKEQRRQAKERKLKARKAVLTLLEKRISVNRKQIREWNTHTFMLSYNHLFQVMDQLRRDKLIREDGQGNYTLIN